MLLLIENFDTKKNKSKWGTGLVYIISVLDPQSKVAPVPIPALMKTMVVIGVCFIFCDSLPVCSPTTTTFFFFGFFSTVTQKITLALSSTIFLRHIL